MKHSYRDTIKPFLNAQILESTRHLQLTQEQIANLLEINPRSYAYLRAGVYMCSATTLLLFLTRICPNPQKFLKEAADILK